MASTRGVNPAAGWQILCNCLGRVVAARRDMRLRRRFFGLVAALCSAVAVAACSPKIHDLNLRPDKFYQQKLSVVGRVMRLQVVGGDTLLEIADQRDSRLLVRVARPVGVSVGDWVKVTGVLVPDARVGDTALYDVLIAEDVSATRGPWLPEIM
jgi:hypothetical protein